VVIENLLLVDLVGVILTVSLTLLRISSELIYPLLLGALAIAVGVIISIEAFKAIEASSPDFKPLPPFLQFIILLVFSLIGITAIFSQYPVIGSVVRMLSIGIAIAFGIVLIPIAFYLAKKLL